MIDKCAYKVGSYHYNWHQSLEILYLLEGEVEVNIDSHRRKMKAGDWALILPNQGHALFSLVKDSLAYRLLIPAEDLLAYQLDLSRGILAFERRPSHQTDFPRLLAQSYYQDKDQEILTYLESVYQPTSKPISSQLGSKVEELQAITQYLEDHLEERIDLDQLAKRFHYSHAYLSRLFKVGLGINWSDYLLRCRLQKALRLLSETHLQVSQIALQVGFRSESSFYRMFKKYFSDTPNGYRQRLSAEHLAVDQAYQASLDPGDLKRIDQYLHRLLETEED